MILSRTILALLLLAAAVLLAAGCISNQMRKEQTENEMPVSVLITAVTPGPVGTYVKSDQERFQELQHYRENLTYPKNRIPENVLLIVDPDFPELLITREQARAQRIADHHLLPANVAIERFNLTNSSDRIPGDLVFLTIYVYPNTTTHILDPFLTNVSNRKEGFHGVEAWVDVNNIEKIAATEGVRSLQFVEFAERS